jgi:hypothetical protein
MRAVELRVSLAICVLLTSIEVHAQHSGYSDENRRLQYSMVQAVGAAIAPHGASLDLDDVYVDPDPENTGLGMPDVLVKISVVQQDCLTANTIAKTIETITFILSAQVMNRIKSVAVSTTTKVERKLVTIDRRDIPYDSMLALRDLEANTRRYLEIGIVQPTAHPETTLVTACTP